MSLLTFLKTFFIIISLTIDIVYRVFHDIKHLELNIWDPAIKIEAFHHNPRMFHTSCIYRNSSNDFNKSTRKCLQCNHGPKNHFIGSCHKFKKKKCKGSQSQSISMYWKSLQLPKVWTILLLTQQLLIHKFLNGTKHFITFFSFMKFNISLFFIDQFILVIFLFYLSKIKD